MSVVYILSIRLVTVHDDADLTALAAARRRLKGRALSRNSGTDIFLTDLSGNYIDRTCGWRECRPGFLVASDFRKCKRRHYLHDNLNDMTLGLSFVQEPDA